MRRLSSAAKAAASVAPSRSLPSVASLAVTVHLVDYKGAQSKVVGRVGQTLVQAASQYGSTVIEDDSSGGGGRNERINSPRWTEMVFGEGAQSYQSHVVLPMAWFDKLPKPSAKEREMLDKLPPSDLKQTSRLATHIILAKELDGMIVHVPDTFPLD